MEKFSPNKQMIFAGKQQLNGYRPHFNNGALIKSRIVYVGAGKSYNINSPTGWTQYFYANLSGVRCLLGVEKWSDDINPRPRSFHVEKWDV